MLQYLKLLLQKIDPSVHCDEHKEVVLRPRVGGALAQVLDQHRCVVAGLLQLFPQLAELALNTACVSLTHALVHEHLQLLQQLQSALS